MADGNNVGQEVEPESHVEKSEDHINHTAYIEMPFSVCKSHLHESWSILTLSIMEFRDPLDGWAFMELVDIFKVLELSSIIRCGGLNLAQRREGRVLLYDHLFAETVSMRFEIVVI